MVVVVDWVLLVCLLLGFFLNKLSPFVFYSLDFSVSTLRCSLIPGELHSLSPLKAPCTQLPGQPHVQPTGGLSPPWALG